MIEQICIDLDSINRYVQTMDECSINKLKLNVLLLNESTLEPASVHLQLLGPVDQHTSIDTKLLNAKEGLLFRLFSLETLRLLLLLLMVVVLARPNRRQLVLVEKVHTRAITTNVKVFFQVSSLAEPDLGKVPSSIITEADLTTRLEDLVDILHCFLPLQRRQCRKNKDEQRDIDRPFPQIGRQLVRRDVPHVGLHVLGVVLFMRTHHLHGLFGEIAGMNLELGVLVLCQNRKSCVARASAYLKERDGASVLSGYLVQDGEFLLQPFTILEEVGCVVLVEQIPPLGRIRVESICLPMLANGAFAINICCKQR